MGTSYLMLADGETLSPFCGQIHGCRGQNHQILAGKAKCFVFPEMPTACRHLFGRQYGKAQSAEFARPDGRFPGGRVSPGKDGEE